MKSFLRSCMSRRFGYDGWAVRVVGAASPFEWTASTTREEARQVKRELETELGTLANRLEVIKVKISVEPK